MRIIIGSDHIGFSLKEKVANHLKSLGISLTDAGTTSPDVPVDYPDFAWMIGSAVASGEYERGILVCRTGIGMSIAANKLPGIRAALCFNNETAALSRAHNDANILCLGSQVIQPDAAITILTEWLKTEFDGEAHTLRVEKVNHLPLPTIKSNAASLYDFEKFKTRLGVAISPTPTSFGPLLFPGTLEAGIRSAAEIGFRAVEISLRSVTDLDTDSLTALLEKHEMVLAAIATGQACVEDGICLCHSKTEIVEKTIQHLQSIIQVASRFHALVIIGGIRGRLSGNSEQQGKQRTIAVQAMRKCIRYAADRGVTVVIEPINRYETNFINSSTEGLAFIEEVCEPSAKLLLDTFHMNIEEVDLPSALRNTGSRIGYIHVSDNNRQAPGYGHIDFAQVFRVLAELDYAGYITAEILPLPDSQTAVLQTWNTLQNLRIPNLKE